MVDAEQGRAGGDAAREKQRANLKRKNPDPNVNSKNARIPAGEQGIVMTAIQGLSNILANQALTNTWERRVTIIQESIRLKTALGIDIEEIKKELANLDALMAEVPVPLPWASSASHTPTSSDAEMADHAVEEVIL